MAYRYNAVVRQPLVSVILPVRDRAAWIARSVASVLDQTYHPLELLVIDDGSTDDTRRVLDGFGSRLRVVSQPPAGAYAARNLGLRHARGEFVAFIDSDDAWFPDRLRHQAPLMADPAVGLVFGDAVRLEFDERGVARCGPSCFQITPPQRGKAAAHFAWGNFVPTSTVLVRRRCLDEVGGFSSASPLSADYLTWFQIALRHRVDYVQARVAAYSVHQGGISHDLGKSLCARIQLFSGELARTTDPESRRILRRLLFNLALHLALARVRGRAPGVPAHLAWRTARAVAGIELGPWAAAFAAHQVLVRGGRRFAPSLTSA